MKTVIVGGGLTGVQLAKRLINQKDDVILIENNAETARHLTNRLNCTVLQEDGNNLDTLEKAGIQKADALVCVTSSDEVNMITCSLVDAVYPHILKIARVRNYAYYTNTANASRQHAETLDGKHRPFYGIDFMVHPDVEAAASILKAVEHGAVTDILTFDNSSYELSRITVEKDSKMAGQSINNVRTLTDKLFSVCYVENDTKAFLPSGKDVINAGDIIGVLTKQENISTILELCGNKTKSFKKIALVGAGRIGTLVAKALLARKKSTTNIFGNMLEPLHKKASIFTIIDSDDEKTKEASAQFSNAKVLCGDITDESFIQEEGIDQYDLAICTTTNHELNMIVSAYLKSIGVKRTISVVSSSTFENIAKNIGVDVAIPIREAVADSIIGHLRGKAIRGIHSVSGGELETIECELPAKSKICGKALWQVAAPGTFLVLLVKKAGENHYMIPVGNTILGEGDRIVLITTAKSNQKTLSIFNGE
ncbi:MAG: Trk system potassium transporter TrkA [Treponema sp.]|nr:Trk system potassium transporter TrkA [Treponema sp.]